MASGSLLGQRTNSSGNIAGINNGVGEGGVLLSPSPYSAIWISTSPLVTSSASTLLSHANGGARKHGKVVGPTSLGYRDRQNLLAASLFRAAGKKRIGMLLALLIAFITFLMLFNALHLASFRPARDWESNAMQKRDVEVIVMIPDSFNEAVNATLGSKNLSSLTANFGVPRWPEIFVEPPLPLGHPCQGFTLPPPPADKKRTGPRPCPVCYLPVEEAIKLMPKTTSTSPMIKNLTFVVELNTSALIRGHGGSDFGGHPTLEQRNEYFQLKESMQVHCGFARGSGPRARVGFDIKREDLVDMERCAGIVVASAIFGNYDELQQPKNISKAAESTICFYMFVDEETYQSFEDGLLKNQKIGLWRIVVIKNLPYSDPRRNGKIPKLLLHRLFPNVHYSLWIDGKLELVVDPYQILERFLWRTKNTFAISQHYKRFDVFEEAEANKAAGKYDNATIDAQIEFYQGEGLTHFSSSKFPIVSDVPEGCVIIREHIPITNLFTCLWFNEVDRFTSRDQLSFAIVRDKLMSNVPWKVSMFRDCERRNFVVQAYHRDVLKQMRTLMTPPLLPLRRSPPMPLPSPAPPRSPPIPLPSPPAPLIVKSSMSDVKSNETSKHRDLEQPTQQSNSSHKRASGRVGRRRRSRQRRPQSKINPNE